MNSNILRGTIGALIGGLVGAAIAVLLLYFGYIAFWSSAVSVVLGAFLYQKFGGKPNWVMLGIVAVVTLVLMTLAVVGTYIVLSGIVINEELAAQGITETISMFEAFSACMELEEFSTIFYRDLALSLVFAVVGVVVEVVYVYQKIKRSAAR